MKIKKIVAVLIILLLLISLIPTITKANMEIKDGGKKWTNISISRAYDECKALNNKESVLGTDKLDAHLTLNTDWGAAAYLAISAYGAVTTSIMPRISINGKSGYTSTTNNITGIIDMGLTFTFTAGVHETGLESESHASDYRQSLINDKTTKYVELLPNGVESENSRMPPTDKELTKGMAIAETSNWFNSKNTYCTSQYPCLLRSGVLGYGDNNVGSTLPWRLSG